MNFARPYNFKKAQIPRWLALTFVFVWVSATLALLGFGLVALHENYLFAAKAVRIQTIVDQKFDQALTTRYGYFRHVRYLSYSYVANATAYSSPAMPVTYDTWTRVELNGPIPIKYLPQAPGDSRIDLPAEDEYFDRTVAVLLILGVVFLFLGFAAIRSRKR